MAFVGIFAETKLRMKKESSSGIPPAIYRFGQPNTIRLALPQYMQLKALVKVSKQTAGNLNVFVGLETQFNRLA